MAKGVLLISPEEDINVHRLRAAISGMGVVCHSIDPVFYEPSFNFVRMGAAEPGPTLVFSSGLKLKLSDIGSVWTRGISYTGGRDILINTPENRIRYEWQYSCEAAWDFLSANAFWVNSLPSIRRASNRLVQKRMAAKFGFRLPDWVITQDLQQARDFASRHASGLVIKLISQGGLAESGPCTVMTEIIRDEHWEQWSGVCPVLLEEYINKVYEIRAAVVGECVFAGAVDTSTNELTQVDSRYWKFSGLEYYPVQLPSSIVDRLVSFNRALGLVYSSFDIGVDQNGEFIFFETNPSGQWTFLEQQTGQSITEAIAAELVRASQ